MKRFFLIFFTFLFSSGMSIGQISKASLQASGLTCAMCSKSVFENLESLSFVESIDTDLNTSVFLIAFKPGSLIDIDLLNKKVQDAGFSVASLRITANFSNITVENDSHILVDGKTFHFLNINPQILNKEVELTIVDKNFIPAKEFKKYSSMTQLNCIKTGKSEICCIPYEVTPSTRIYHVTI